MKTDSAFSQPLTKMNGGESLALGGSTAEGLVHTELEPYTRLKFVVGNWKMHTNAAEAKRLAEAIVYELGIEDRVAIAICPPFPYLGLVGEILKGSRIALGAQNLYPEKEGAFTGEVSPTMLVDLGCKYVILGHSERRHKLGESDAFINHKVRVALETGIDVILCVGETLDQREAGQTEAVLDRQLIQGLARVPKGDAQRVTIAYEPVWAIGNGRQASTEQVEEAHAIIRRRFSRIYDKQSAQALVIQYGGSVGSGTAVALLKSAGVDGVLIGGASLKPDEFVCIMRAGIK